MNRHFSANLRRLRLDKGFTQEQAAAALGVSAQSVSRWETSTTLPDVMLLPEIARLYGVLVDDLFKPSPKGYANNALRLLAVFEHSHKPEDFLAAVQEFDKLIREGHATANDWRSCGIAHEYMVYHCIEKAAACYDKAMSVSRSTDQEMYHRTIRQRTLLRSRIGQASACIAEQQEAVRRDPSNPDAWADLAHALSCGDQPEETLKTCIEAIAHFPGSAILHIFAGDACRTLRKYGDAFSHWEAAIRLDDRFSDALFSMAFCHEELVQYDQAASVWDDIAYRLEKRGLKVEAQWPREMAAKCRARMK